MVRLYGKAKFCSGFFVAAMLLIRFVYFFLFSFSVSKKYREYEDLREQHHIDVLKHCNVIGMTVTGAAVRANQLGRGCELLL